MRSFRDGGVIGNLPIVRLFLRDAEALTVPLRNRNFVARGPSISDRLSPRSATSLRIAVLAIELQGLVNLDFDGELTGFSLDEAKIILDEARESAPDGDDPKTEDRI